jgi:hypothetical protein
LRKVKKGWYGDMGAIRKIDGVGGKDGEIELGRN